MGWISDAFHPGRLHQDAPRPQQWASHRGKLSPDEAARHGEDFLVQALFLAVSRDIGDDTTLFPKPEVAISAAHFQSNMKSPAASSNKRGTGFFNFASQFAGFAP